MDSTITQVLAFAFASLIAYAIYALHFHPLAKFPGPKLWALTSAPYLLVLARGSIVLVSHQLHERYGPVVRIAPNFLIYTDSRAWQDILGFHRSPFLLHPKWYKPQPNGVPSMLAAPEPDHTRIRRLVAHAFSEKALKEQEGLIQGYVNELIHQLRRQCRQGPVNLVDWFNFLAFDVIGDLAFADSYNSLTSTYYRPFISEAVAAFKSGVYFHVAMAFPAALPLIYFLTPKGVLDQFRHHFENSCGKVQKRLALSDGGRRDFMAYMRREKNDQVQVTDAELESTFSLLVAAGTETTATSLSAAITLLLQHPSALVRLTEETRTAFSTSSDVTMEAVKRLPLLNGVIEETLRLYPPVPAILPRIVPPEGAKVCDDWLPGGTEVSTSNYSMHHAAHNFSNPEEFIPERWMPAQAEGAKPQFVHDTKAFRPFSYGMRDCVGRNLAYAEMRLVLARVLLDFNLDGNPRSWNEQKSYIFWELRGLEVKMTEVSR